MVPDLITYSAVVSACEKSQDAFGQALKLFNAMPQLIYFGTVVPCNAVINACAQEGETMQAEWWLQYMLDNGVEADVVSYHTVVNACAQKDETRRKCSEE